MKRYTLFSLVLLMICPLWVRAQLQKGTWYASGTGGVELPVAQGLAGFSTLTTQNSAEINLTGLSISPELGYFFSDHLLAGSRLAFSTAFGNDVVDVSGLAVAPFLRYYINPKAANNHFYANAQLNIQVLGDNQALGAGVALGMTHFLAPGLGLDLSLALIEPDFQIRRNTQLGLFTGLNVFLNPELKANRKQATSALQSGSLMIGGTAANAQLNILSPRTGGSSVRGINFSPNLLYFVNNRLGLGAALTLSSFGFADGNFSSTLLGLSPRVRYYFNTDRHRLLFVTGAYHYDWGKVRLDEEENEANVSRASLALGVNSFFTPNLALELAPNLNYNFEAETFRIGLDLGIQFFLHPRK